MKMSVLQEVLNYVLAKKYSIIDGLYKADQRGEINSRLLGWSRELERQGLSFEKAALLTAILGELGNNSFDHNLGKWSDRVGCIVAISMMSDRVRIAVGDCGQGIAESLKRIKPGVVDNAALLKIAFEEIVSGRSPEKRGNGLKFIRKNFLTKGGISLVCLSSGAKYILGEDTQLNIELSTVKILTGTVTVIDWGLK